MRMDLHLHHLKKRLGVRNFDNDVWDLPRVVLWNLLNIPDIIFWIPNNCCLSGVAHKMDIIFVVSEGTF